MPQTSAIAARAIDHSGMREPRPSSAAREPASEVISLQTLVDAHLQRLLSCQTAVLCCHAGLLGLDESQMDHYRSLTPPLPTVGAPSSFLQGSLQARRWLAASALRDLLMLHSIYFEQMRQMLGLARILEAGGNEEEKRNKARTMVADKPVDSTAMLARLDDLLEGNWPRKQEFQTMETLCMMFAALTSGQEKTLPKEPISVELCLPEFQSQPTGGNVDYTVRKVTRTFTQPDEAEPDRAFFYEIFFTAVVICKESSEAVAARFTPE